MNFLTKYQTILPKFQFQQFLNYFKQRSDAGENLSTSGFSRNIDEAIKQIDPTNLQLFNPTQIATFSRTNSKVYNGMMDIIKMDLMTLFKESNLSFYVLGLQENLNKDFNDNVVDAITQLQGELEAQRIKFGNESGQKHVVLETFTDMIGRVFQNTLIRHGTLTLDTKSVDVNIYTLQNAKVYRYPRAGIDLFVSKSNDVELDPTLLQPGLHNGYWAEMILSDVLPKLEFYDHDIIPRNQVFQGVLIILRLTFATPISLNSLDIDPFTVFELGIPWIRYQQDISQNWYYLMSEGNRVCSQGREIISFRNIDRVNQVKVLEIPFYQVNAITDRYTIPKVTKYNVDFLEDIFTGKYTNLCNSETNDVYLPSEETNYTLSSNIILTDQLDNVFSKLSQLLGLDSIKFKRIGSNFVTEPEDSNELFFEQTEKYEYIYGAYSILPMDIKYKSQGLYVSQPVDLVSQSINSFSLFVNDSQPAKTCINYFIEIDSGNKYAIVPMGMKRIREYIPITDASAVNVFPRAYTTSEDSAKEYIIQQGCSGTTISKFIPTFYVDEDEPYIVYKNGVAINGMKLDTKERYLYVDTSGNVDEFLPLTTTDSVMVDYYMDDLYQPPGRMLFPGTFNVDYSSTISGEVELSGDTSGLYILSFAEGSPRDKLEDYDLYFGLSDTQWIKIDRANYVVEDPIIRISGDIIRGMAFPCGYTDIDSINFMFEYYSTDNEFNGNFGRRDFPGNPYTIDLMQTHLARSPGHFGVLPEYTAFKSLYLQQTSEKYKLTNYVIELPSIPAIDFRLYNYDGTWMNDPSTAGQYYPIKVMFGNTEAMDRTNYLGDQQHLHPYEDAGAYEYYLKKNILYFNTKSAIPEVTVTYRYITKTARLVAELYSMDTSYTPVVYNYTLNVGTIDW